jgi:hypothetical protein
VSVPEDEPVVPPQQEAPRSAVPVELVGAWDGDDADYTFSTDGTVSISGIGSGTVVVEGSYITFYIPGVEPWTVEWYVDVLC